MLVRLFVEGSILRFVLKGLRPLVVESRNFTCPNEEVDRSYQKFVMMETTKLFFLPARDVQKVGEYIECVSCSTTYEVAVLDRDPGVMAYDSVTQGLRRLAVAVVAMDDLVTFDERQAVIELLNDRVGLRYTVDELVEDLLALVDDDLQSVLETAGSATNLEGRETIMRGAWHLIRADGDVGDGELALLETAREALGLSHQQFHKIIGES